MQYGKESAEFLASVALASRLTRGTCANACAHNTVSSIKYVALHACICEPRSVFGTDLTHELFLLEAEKGDNAGITRPSQLAHHRLEVHHPGAAKKHELFLEGKHEYLPKMQNTFPECLPSRLSSPCVDTLEPLHGAVAEPRVSTKKELCRQI